MNFQNDAAILNATTRSGNTLTFPGDLLPAGTPLSAQFEQVNADAGSTWCEMVRMEYERQTQQVAKARSSKASPEADSGRGDSEARQSRGGGKATEETDEAFEEALQSRKARLEAALNHNADEQLQLVQEYRELSRQLKAVEAALCTYKAEPESE